jgi:hypothetical protein
MMYKLAVKWNAMQFKFVIKIIPVSHSFSLRFITKLSED